MTGGVVMWSNLVDWLRRVLYGDDSYRDRDTLRHLEQTSRAVTLNTARLDAYRADLDRLELRVRKIENTDRRETRDGH